MYNREVQTPKRKGGGPTKALFLPGASIYMVMQHLGGDLSSAGRMPVAAAA